MPNESALSPESAKLIEALEDNAGGPNADAAYAALSDHLRELERDRERMNLLEKERWDVLTTFSDDDIPLWIIQPPQELCEKAIEGSLRAAIDAAAAAPAERDG